MSSAVVLAFILAFTLTPAIIRFLVRQYSASAHGEEIVDGKKHAFRNTIIGLSGVVFLIAGCGITFLFQQTNSLDPTLPNIVAILAFGALATVSGMAVLANLLGDLGAQNFLQYYERTYGISSKGVRTLSKVIAICAIVSLLGLIILS